jgi:hypothetical protein
MTPGDRRELRSLIKKQFAVLRNDVKRRASEMEAEVEAELLRRYRDEDDAVRQAASEIAKARDDYQRACQAVIDALQASHPDVKARLGYHGLEATNANRTQLRRAAIAAIPQQISDAQTRLDQQEIDLLRDLTVGGLDTDQAQRFIGSIPTVGELVPRARLQEIEIRHDR